MENNISFTGINNLYTGKKLYSKFSPFTTPNGKARRGRKNYTEILIKCNLTNDKSGSDLTEFWNALNKSSGSYQVRSVIKNTTDSILFFVKRSTINYKGKDIVNSEFTLNNIAIAANDREVLPLFTYLAKLTRTLAAKPEISVEKTQLLKTANKSIEEEAMRYIDNMY